VGPSSLSARRLAAVLAAAAFVLVGAAALLTRHDPPLAVAPAKAVRLAAASPELRGRIAAGDVPKVLHVDDELVKVMWYRDGRAVATAGVRTDGSVLYGGRYRNRAGWGAKLTHDPAVLAGLTLLFLLAVLRRPLRSARTVDVLALAALVVPTFLIDRGRFGVAEGLAAVLLLWLGARGAWVAAAGPDRTEAPALLTAAAARWRLPRLPAQLTLAVLAATLLTIVLSDGLVDIALADMEGATLLTHGVLPYGHMPGDVVHGDTYGLLVYALYAPFAAVWPMHDSWDAGTGALVAGALVVLLCLAGVRAVERGTRWPALLALLAFPASLMSASSGTNDVLIAAALIWAFAWWSRPAASSALVMAAGVAKVAPLVLVPLWLARLRGRDLRRAVAACAAVGAACLAGLVALGGLDGPGAMARAIAFQLDRRSELSVWTALGLQPLQPLATGLSAAAVAGAVALAWRDRAVAADPRRVAGLVTAVLAVLQVAANHWAPMYLLWFAPPALLALAGPLGAPAPARAPAAADDPAGIPDNARFAPV
jgi:hypothetical protein